MLTLAEQKFVIDIIKGSINDDNLVILPVVKTINYLEENRVLLPFLQGLQSLPDSKVIALKKEIEFRLSKDYVTDLNQLTDFAASFLDNLKVDWISHKHSFFTRQRGDLDVLVKPEQFYNVIKKLKEHGFNEIAKERSKIKMSKIENSFNYTIHIHEKIIWETEFIPTDDVWKRSQIVKVANSEVKIPSPEDSILIECVHAFFETRGILLATIFQFIELLKHYKIDWLKITEHLISYKLQAVGFLYLLAMNKILNNLLNEKPIPDHVIKELKNNIDSREINAVSKIKKKTLEKDIIILPLKFDLISSGVLFMSFNSDFGLSRRFWSAGIVISATFRYLLVKLRIKKL